jgi:hypothetical protein
MPNTVILRISKPYQIQRQKRVQDAKILFVTTNRNINAHPYDFTIHQREPDGLDI